MPEINFELTSQRGPLKVGLRINLEGSYIVLVGPNDTAKTSILQAIFRTQVPVDTPQGKSETCLILPERIFVDITTQTGTRLEFYNQQLASTMLGSNKRDTRPKPPKPLKKPSDIHRHHFLQQF